MRRAQGGETQTNESGDSPSPQATGGHGPPARPLEVKPARWPVKGPLYYEVEKQQDEKKTENPNMKITSNTLSVPGKATSINRKWSQHNRNRVTAINSRLVFVLFYTLTRSASKIVKSQQRLTVDTGRLLPQSSSLRKGLELSARWPIGDIGRRRHTGMPRCHGVFRAQQPTRRDVLG